MDRQVTPGIGHVRRGRCRRRAAGQVPGGREPPNARGACARLDNQGRRRSPVSHQGVHGAVEVLDLPAVPAVGGVGDDASCFRPAALDGAEVDGGVAETWNQGPGQFGPGRTPGLTAIVGNHLPYGEGLEGPSTGAVGTADVRGRKPYPGSVTEELHGSQVRRRHQCPRFEPDRHLGAR